MKLKAILYKAALIIFLSPCLLKSIPIILALIFLCYNILYNPLPKGIINKPSL